MTFWEELGDVIWAGFFSLLLAIVATAVSGGIVFYLVGTGGWLGATIVIVFFYIFCRTFSKLFMW